MAFDTRETYRQRSEAKPNGAPPPPLINAIDWSTMIEEPPPRRRFIVADWLPVPCLSSLYGPPGVGKSLLAQQLLACVATGRDFLGSPIERSPVLGLFGEDDDQELKWRQWWINRSLGLTFADLACSGYHIQGRAGLDNALATWPKNGPQREPFLDAVIRYARDEAGARLIVLDNRAQMCLVDENDRAAATWSSNLLAGIARVIDGSVLLIGHTAKAIDSPYSGSTGWDAVTRSRLWIRRDPESATGGIILSREKANYAAPDTVDLVLADHVLSPLSNKHQTGADRFRTMLRQEQAAEAFLHALDTLASQGRTVSHAPRASSYAPRAMQEIVDDFSVRELEAAMTRLFAAGRIKANAPVFKGADRKWRMGIARAPDEEMEEAGHEVGDVPE
jgi:RecA-family ATPase